MLHSCRYNTRMPIGMPARMRAIVSFAVSRSEKSGSLGEGYAVRRVLLTSIGVRREPGQAGRAVLQIARINRGGHERRKSMINAPAVSGHRLSGFRQQRPFAMSEVSAAASGLLLSAMGSSAETKGPVRTRVAAGCGGMSVIGPFCRIRQ
jgi:hypothetical protein